MGNYLNKIGSETIYFGILAFIFLGLSIYFFCKKIEGTHKDKDGYLNPYQEYKDTHHWVLGLLSLFTSVIFAFITLSAMYNNKINKIMF